MGATRKDKNHKPPNKLHWILLFFFVSIAIVFVQMNATDFQVSVIPTKTHAPYNGTTLPILKAPDFVHLTAEERNYGYTQLPLSKVIPIPKYDPAEIRTSTESLGWSSERDLSIRNAKITYSVAYMGNYKLDGRENAGSHLAVDIKIPIGTPVFAIGNGQIVKVSNQTTGFGKHIVIRHDNFPSYNSASTKATYYSSYSHLGLIKVNEGDLVTKGQRIAESGDTGTATTPHLHFQIDNTDAPWHPYWPFTFQEAQNAGYSFFEAVNAGLGKDKALKTTVNPMMYVQKYLDAGSTSSGATTPTTTTTPSPSDSEVTVSSTRPGTRPSSDTTTSELPPPVITAPPEDEPEDEPDVEPEANDGPAVGFRINHDGEFIQGVDEIVTIEAIDDKGHIVKSYQPSDIVQLKTLVGAADIPAVIRKNYFTNGIASIEITPTTDQGLVLIASDNSIEGESDIMRTATFTDVDSDNEHYDAIIALKQRGMIQGYPDGTFQSENTVSRVEALKFIFEGLDRSDLTEGNPPFSDTEAGQWYTKYVNTAYGEGIIAGYPDGSFKPSSTVNKVEFLKMLLIAMDVDLETDIDVDIYSDVSKDDWFAPYVLFAKNNNLVDVENDTFGPEEGMSRGEVAEAIYRLIEL
ncbi:S-layer homology domain-containing protein [Pseudomonadota bacterium]